MGASSCGMPPPEKGMQWHAVSKIIKRRVLKRGNRGQDTLEIKGRVVKRDTKGQRRGNRGQYTLKLRDKVLNREREKKKRPIHLSSKSHEIPVKHHER